MDVENQSKHIKGSVNKALDTEDQKERRKDKGNQRSVHDLPTGLKTNCEERFGTDGEGSSKLMI